MTGLGNGRIAHVFPYHPAQIHEDFDSWRRGQMLRWPLAAVARSRHAPRTSVHLIASRPRTVTDGGLRIVAHPEVLGGPRYWGWGDDWSWSLEWTLRRLRAEDVCVVHLNWFWAAHAVERAARRCRVVVVVHGTDLGPWDIHLSAADAIVLLRDDHVERLLSASARPDRAIRVTPSLDKNIFRPSDRSARQGALRKLGFIGRLSREKGIFDIPGAVAAARDGGIEVAVEMVGKGDDDVVRSFQELCLASAVADNVTLLGSLTPTQVAIAMQDWDLLLAPSWYEGCPITVLEACATGLPVVAVTGVLSPELEGKPGIWTTPRESYAEMVVRVLRHSPEALPTSDWIPTHEQGAAAWDDVIERLPQWTERELPLRRTAARWRRFRGPLGPLRSALARAER